MGSNGRLQGRLEVSRAFGDRHFKKVTIFLTYGPESFNCLYIIDLIFLYLVEVYLSGVGTFLLLFFILLACLGCECLNYCMCFQLYLSVYIFIGLNVQIFFSCLDKCCS